MQHSQFLRLERKAGGDKATNREFIKACHSVVHPEGRTHSKRKCRHEWIRSGLEKRAKWEILLGSIKF